MLFKAWALILIAARADENASCAEEGDLSVLLQLTASAQKAVECDTKCKITLHEDRGCAGRSTSVSDGRWNLTGVFNDAISSLEIDYMAPSCSIVLYEHENGGGDAVFKCEGRMHSESWCEMRTGKQSFRRATKRGGCYEVHDWMNDWMIPSGPRGSLSAVARTTEFIFNEDVASSAEVLNDAPCNQRHDW
eukprot:TRINITY_DN70221_c0_g1_i1.p1 TRINITY_DN70221_c0_g1~~TRINITY_DN70221_c0_g1_i1.p1  ORF type:complete len:191 (+),score=30.52 TRINITY_DN70221_c0_g1_i1:73-645(+)